MAEAELQTYRDQLAFVNLSLDADPENSDLLSLRTELLEIIELTEAALPPSSSAKTSSSTAASKDKGKGKEVAGGSNTNWQDQGTYKAGMDCMAKYKDGKMYPARINAVIGSQESPLYTITFKGYSTSTNVPLSSLRPHDPTAPIPQPQKRPVEELSEREKAKKKVKGDKWVAAQAARTEDMKEKKQAWDKFGKKAAKKGIHIAGLQGKSEFKTSDAVGGRVGVVGSGKPVTQYNRMGKHKFERDEE